MKCGRCLAELIRISIIFFLFLFGCGEKNKPNEPENNPPGESIAFTIFDGAFQYIGVINPDGSNRSIFALGDTIASGPKWSPDHSLIFYYHEGFDVSYIGLIDVDDNSTTQVSSIGARFGSSPWSPDGSAITFTIQWGTQPGLYYYQLNSTDPTLIVENAQDAQEASFISNNDIIFVFGVRMGPGGGFIAKTPIGGGQIDTLTNYIEDGAYHSLRYCATSDKIIFAVYYGIGYLNQQIWIMNSDGSDKDTLLSAGFEIDNGSFFDIAISGDGLKIAIVFVNEDAPYLTRLYIFWIQSEDLYLVGNCSPSGVDWSPDSENIVYTASNGNLVIADSMGNLVNPQVANHAKNPDW